MIRSYTELSKLATFQERFDYLKIPGTVGSNEDELLGQRYTRQKFYQSSIWKQIKRQVIIRDNGCDMGLEDFQVLDRFVVIHHMNPITVDDVINMTEFAINPEYLITVSDRTHRAIHYGSFETIPQQSPTVRQPNDTCPWRT